MTELYKADEQQETFQDEIYRSLDRKAQIAEFKKANPMHRLLRSKTESGSIILLEPELIPTFLDGIRFGLIDEETSKITQAGIDWLNAPFEL